MISRSKPLENETALGFVERLDDLGADEDVINKGLREHFGFTDDGEMKELKLQSAPFWERFYVDHARLLRARGAARFAAVNFIRRKNGRNGQKTLSDDEIEHLVESVGEWQR